MAEWDWEERFFWILSNCLMSRAGSKKGSFAKVNADIEAKSASRKTILEKASVYEESSLKVTRST